MQENAGKYRPKFLFLLERNNVRRTAMTCSFPSMNVSCQSDVAKQDRTEQQTLVLSCIGSHGRSLALYRLLTFKQDWHQKEGTLSA